MPGVISEPLKGCSKRESLSPRSRIAKAFSLWAISSIQAILLKYSSDCWKFSFDTVSLTGKLMQEAIIRYGTPTIFNTDKGCQITSQEFTGLLKPHGILISMDGKGCWRDNVFVERLWKSITYEEAYLHADDTVRAAHQGLQRYLTFYNQTRPHARVDQPMNRFLSANVN
jgi:transposase InsO family protein